MKEGESNKGRRKKEDFPLPEVEADGSIHQGNKIRNIMWDKGIKAIDISNAIGYSTVMIWKWLKNGKMKTDQITKLNEGITKLSPTRVNLFEILGIEKSNKVDVAILHDPEGEKPMRILVGQAIELNAQEMANLPQWLVHKINSIQ